MQKYYGKIIKGFTKVQQNAVGKKPELKDTHKLIKYPPKDILKQISDSRKNFGYIILWMLNNNESIEWVHFKADPVNIPQFTLSNYLKELQDEGYIEKVRRGEYKITLNGIKRFNELQNLKGKNRIPVYHKK